MMARLLEGPRTDLILIPCKSAGLGWGTVEAILRHRPIKHRIDEATLNLAFKDYGKLTAETAERTLRFWQLHNKRARYSTTKPALIEYGGYKRSCTLHDLSTTGAALEVCDRATPAYFTCAGDDLLEPIASSKSVYKPLATAGVI